MTRKMLAFVAVVAAILLLQILGASIIVPVIYVASQWQEHFVGNDMQEVALIGALTICIGAFFGVIIGANRMELWWKLRKIRRSH